ncbi:5'-adenylylsulfate reductase-like 4 [Telopea speciosissima]|uniref:5'-adenylylsulfate reductase-like 4 n=1 Tax=Telopea speciosissima TaxID=54955 RepID=UPI001CC52A3F|nr:5'-adenylylsulfate reductase-like 4 [Telopea speciosissima]
MATRVWQTGILLLLVFGRVTCVEVEPLRVPSSSSSAVCPVASFADLILQFQDLCWDPDWLSNGGFGGNFVSVTEGDEVSLQKALNLVHRNSHEYVSMLFYASWCPFSRTCRPTFTVLSSLYPSIRHFAVEESAIRPSILSRYGVHGFPTLFLLNSTMRVRYHGSRTLSSLVAFYTDVTGIKPASLVKMSGEKSGDPSNLAKLEDSEQESCPFSWARSPENMLRQETYLALATTFVLLRFLYFIYPTLVACAQYIWRRHVQDANLVSLWKLPLVYLNQAVQVSNVLKEPCKRRNLQGGAINARVWASKSLASVSIGDASSSRGYSGNERS